MPYWIFPSVSRTSKFKHNVLGSRTVKVNLYSKNNPPVIFSIQCTSSIVFENVGIFFSITSKILRQDLLLIHIQSPLPIMPSVLRH